MIRVVIVDDSAIVRKTLSEHLSRSPDIHVIGTAGDPYIARDIIVREKPDVLTLDIEMPRMDGLSFLAKLMRYYPIPVVVVSSLTPENSETAIRALELGAVGVIGKPGTAYSTKDIGREVVEAVRAAAKAKPVALALPGGRPRPAPASSPAPVGAISGRLLTTQKVIAIGASTGGTNALEAVLSELPPMTPGTVVVQHMPKPFTKPFADRLDSVCAMEVREAADGDAVVQGVVLVAPGDEHMVVVRSGARYHVRLTHGPAVHHQRPSVDVLFESVAENVGRNAVGAILTGMGADGAAGLLSMKKAGARTIAQDEATCVVFGMPREAIAAGGVDEVLPLGRIAGGLLAAVAAGRPAVGAAEAGR
ncbi:MAG: chemotaxis response regulator protein-glutamate methylesterase, partial [Candidatus Eisenbacteria bacterium]|nr:chemotaxis response regulator protein-glutamate methylesterase [Candidatus Eisenbacteria bacterium]